MEKAFKTPIYTVLVILFLGMTINMEAASGLEMTKTQAVTTQKQKKLSFKERVALKILKKRIRKAQKKATKQALKPTKTTKTNGLFRGLGRVLLGALGVAIGALLIAGGVLSLNFWGLVVGLGLVFLGAYGIVKGVFTILW